MSSEEEFDGSSDDDFGGSFVDDFGDVVEVEGDYLNDDPHDTLLENNITNEISGYSCSTVLNNSVNN